MDHSKHVRLASSELTGDVLKNAAIYGADDQKVGTVSHIHGSEAASQVVIDVGGFLGIGAKPVAVPIGSLDFMRDEDGEVHAVTSWTKDQLKEMPEHSIEDRRRRRGRRLPGMTTRSRPLRLAA